MQIGCRRRCLTTGFLVHRRTDRSSIVTNVIIHNTCLQASSLHKRDYVCTIIIIISNAPTQKYAQRNKQLQILIVQIRHIYFFRHSLHARYETENRTIVASIYWRSPRMRRASCMSLTWIVTRLAWMAQRLVSSNTPKRCFKPMQYHFIQTIDIASSYRQGRPRQLPGAHRRRMIGSASHWTPNPAQSLAPSAETAANGRYQIECCFDCEYVHLANQQPRWLLKAADLAKSNRSRSKAMRALAATSHRSTFSHSLVRQLLARVLGVRVLARRLLGARHSKRHSGRRGKCKLQSWVEISIC